MTALQGLALLLVLQSVGELTVRALGWPVPGPVLGLLLLLPLLALPFVAHRVEAAATVLLQHLSLLFVPGRGGSHRASGRTGAARLAAGRRDRAVHLGGHGSHGAAAEATAAPETADV